MDDPDRMLHSSFPFISHENERSFQKPGCENEPPLRKRRRKSYMQPTISAVSKSVVPKKKNILGERNDDSESTSSVTPVKKSRILEQKLSFGPYENPFRNYLSPGHKFLRYDPNYQRRDILCRNDKGLEVECEGRSSSDEENEDADERMFWRFKGVPNYMVLFAVLVLSILFLYVSSVKSPDISSVLRVLNDGSYRIRNRFFTFISSLQDGRKIDSLIDVSPDHAMCEVAIENVGADEELSEVAGKQDGKTDRMGDEEKFSDQETDFVDIGFRNSETLEDFDSLVPDEASHQDLDNDAMESEGEISDEEIGNEEVSSNEVKEIEDKFRLGKGIIVTVMSSGILIIIGLGFQSSLTAKPIDKSVAEEKCSLEIEETKDTENVDSFVEQKSKCCVQSRSEVYQELAWREASSAELLWELALGDMSSSLRMCRTCEVNNYLNI